MNYVNKCFINVKIIFHKMEFKIISMLQKNNKTVNSYKTQIFKVIFSENFD